MQRAFSGRSDPARLFCRAHSGFWPALEASEAGSLVVDLPAWSQIDRFSCNRHKPCPHRHCRRKPLPQHVELLARLSSKTTFGQRNGTHTRGNAYLNVRTRCSNSCGRTPGASKTCDGIDFAARYVVAPFELRGMPLCEFAPNGALRGPNGAKIRSPDERCRRSADGRRISRLSRNPFHALNTRIEKC